MDSNIKTFNPAKKFAEEVLHPLIVDEAQGRKKCIFGAYTVDVAHTLNNNVRVLNRFEGLKERITAQEGLINESLATVRTNKRKKEILLLRKIQKYLYKLRKYCRDKREEILYVSNFAGREKAELTNKHDEIIEKLDRTNEKIQFIMIKNNLLFFGEKDQILKDKDIRRKIVEENRMA